jgi:heme-degrading monooxygenase HmoA
MLCALTVRQVKPGAAEQFLEAFRPSQDDMPGGGWKSFNAIRDLNDENRVVTFGFFDGSLEDLEASQEKHNFGERRDRASEFVDEVVVNGVFEVVMDMDADKAAKTA